MRSCDDDHLGTDSMTSLRQYPVDSVGGQKLTIRNPTGAVTERETARIDPAAPAVVDALPAARAAVSPSTASQQASSILRSEKVGRSDQNRPGRRIFML